MKKLMTLLASAMIMILVSSCCSNSPKSVVENYYKAIKAGDYEKALSYTEIGSDKEATAAFIEKVSGIEYKLDKYEVIDEVIALDGKTATVKVKISFSTNFGNETDLEEMESLELIDGEWKIKL